MESGAQSRGEEAARPSAVVRRRRDAAKVDELMKC